MLAFPEELSPEPIIDTLGQQFNIEMYLNPAEPPDEEDRLVIELNGKAEDIEAGLAWAMSKGVRADTINIE